MISIARARSSETTLFAILITVGLIGGVLAFPLDYFGNSNVVIGLCLFPFTLLIEGGRRNNLIYVALLVMFATLASIYGVRIFYFFAVAFYFVWLIEFFVGRLNVLILFLIFLASPFFIQLVTILGFPLRLMLSEYAGSVLNLTGTNVRVEGNMMMIDDLAFSVDEACMGLNMLSISMLMGVSVLVYRYRLSNKFLGLWSSIFFFEFVLVVNVFTNLTRIIALVYFRIPPEDPMHELVGIICLISYVAIPVYFFGGWFVKKYGRSRTDLDVNDVARTGVLVFLLPIVIIVAGASFENNQQASSVVHADVQFAGGTSEQLHDGITKISTSGLLIYVKAIPEFFTGEHTPLMCWKGSGYEFSAIATTTIADVTIYKGLLVKEGKTLYTAWWYNNGDVTTISQLDWRMRMLRGENRFCLVNVTSDDEDALYRAVESVFKSNLLVIKKTLP